MTFLNIDRTIVTIVEWLRTYCKLNGKSSLIVDLSKGIESAVVATLCNHSRIPTIGVSFREPPPIISPEISIIKTDLDEFSKVKQSTEFEKYLHTPILVQIAKKNNGIVVGVENTCDKLIGSYYKYDAADIEPIAQLYRSEIIELANKLNIPAVPNEHPEITYDEIEWADREDIRVGIISNCSDPAKHKAWLGYTGRQREVIAKVHQYSYLNRHKKTRSVLDLKEISGLKR